MSITIILGLIIILLQIISLLSNKNYNFIKFENKIENFEKSLEKTDKLIREENCQNRKEINDELQKNRIELTNSSKSLTDTLLKQINNLIVSVENKLLSIQKDNKDQLEKMRETVDEKLHLTLEKRLNDSFKLVTDKLENVHKGFIEMQQLAIGVGDLKKVLTNIKSRGGWGEVQLSRILEDFMSPSQYEKNVVTKKESKDQVEYAIKLPGREDSSDCVWLPIDAKFPKEDYEKLMEAQDKGDIESVEIYGKSLEKKIKEEALKIYTKYIDPPGTTDFGIMFLPTEGLYAEIVRRPGLCDQIQRESRIMIAGPSTLAALLNSLQMGFRTLAIQKRSSEVWKLLEIIRNEFGKFGGLLEKTHEKINQAGKSIEEAAKKSKTIERKLNKVQQLPEGNESLLLSDIVTSEEEINPES